MGDDPTNQPIRRRPLLLALAGSGVAFTGIGVAARTVLSGDGTGAGGDTETLQLTGGDALVPTLTLPLADRLAAAPVSRRARTLWLDVATVTMVGLTWRRGAPAPQVELSTRVGDVWRPWQPMPHVHEPSGTEDEGLTVGTDVVWTGPADGIRLRVHGEPPPELALVLLHPAELPADDVPGDPEAAVTNASLVSTAPRRQRRRRVPRPRMYGRRVWGANESWRDGDPVYNDTIKQVHVHHTVSSNDYRPKDVPAMIRGMYAYHTKSLGWSDLGYNFLVDRFGRTWVGRAGGPKHPVRGAHTLGFNSTSTGVAVIGNFETAKPSRQVIGAIARLSAWKLDMYGRNPEGRIRVESSGSDRYRSGTRVRLRVIDGHRDTNQTACPGKHLYAALPRVRRRAAARIARFERRQ